jgi:hypothetical protein
MDPSLAHLSRQIHERKTVTAVTDQRPMILPVKDFPAQGKVIALQAKR